jgi:leucyl aminopeptidase (aminopeptidase T)
LGCDQAQQADTTTPAAEVAPPADVSVDFDALSANIVTQSIGIREGDHVLITGGAENIELLEDLAVHARSVGAFPMITLQSDRLTRRMVVDVPEQYDTQQDAFALALVDLIDVAITVDQASAPDLLADVPDQRMARRAQTGSAIVDAFEKSDIRLVNLGNSMHPSPSNAARLGLAQGELARVFWASVGVDPATLQARGEALRGKLAAGQVLHITAPNGTDLTVNIASRPSFVSDGMITEEEVAKGGASKFLWLPAGEVYVAPVPGSAEGTVVADHNHEGQQIPGLTLTFAGGKLTGMTATSGIEPVQSAFDAAAGDRKSEFAVVDFGINPAVKSAAGTPIRTWVADGIVSVGVGNNTWAGGDNNAPYALFLHIPNATVTLDGTVIVDGGVIR